MNETSIYERHKRKTMYTYQSCATLCKHSNCALQSSEYINRFWKIANPFSLLVNYGRAYIYDIHSLCLSYKFYRILSWNFFTLPEIIRNSQSFFPSDPSILFGVTPPKLSGVRTYDWLTHDVEIREKSSCMKICYKNVWRHFRYTLLFRIFFRDEVSPYFSYNKFGLCVRWHKWCAFFTQKLLFQLVFFLLLSLLV